MGPEAVMDALTRNRFHGSTTSSQINPPDPRSEAGSGGGSGISSPQIPDPRSACTDRCLRSSAVGTGRTAVGYGHRRSRPSQSLCNF